MIETAPVLLMLGRLIIDDLHYPDGRIVSAVAGGAGLHAAAGARLWWPRVAPTCGVGLDLHDLTNGLLIADGYVLDGLSVRSPHSVRSCLVYLSDGTRTETSVHGARHFDSLAVSPGDVPATLLPAAATYVFHGAEPAHWSAIGALRPRLGPLLWELLLDAARPEPLADIGAALAMVDIFSLNSAEAEILFGAIPPSEVIDRLLRLGAAVVVLRMGAEGAWAANQRLRLLVRPPRLRVIDETGAGNSFCGGFLAGWCLRPGDLAHALRCAVGAACCTLERFGPARAGDGVAARQFAEKATVVEGVEQAA